MRILLNSDNLTNEVISNVEQLMEVVLSSPIGEFVDVDGFAKKLDTLKVEKKSINEPLKYNRMTNVLEINPDFSNEDYDYKFLLMKEVLSMLVPNGGFQDYPEFKTLDQGIRENFAEVLVGNEGMTNYENEKVIANLFALLFEK